MNIDSMLELARQVRERAYAPYSGYKVGAVAVSGDQAFSGCNVENVSYSLTTCAERAAIYAMVATGRTRLDELLLLTEDGATPCGGCLQVLMEFAADPESLPVHLAAADGRVATLTLKQLLPHGFSSAQVPRT